MIQPDKDAYNDNRSAEHASRTRLAEDLRIGKVQLDGRVLLAPMAGITDAGMRRIAAEAGASLTFTEMVAAKSLTRGDDESRTRARSQGRGGHAVQIAGCEAGDLAEAARFAEDAGAQIVDINMGCPAKRVTGGFAGSALMRNLEHAAGLIRATVAAVSVPVTVKMRLGWDEASLNAAELARIAEAEGVQLVTVHGRTRHQFYNGTADWRAVRAVKAAVRIPVVVNGDCVGIVDARRMLEQSGADAVMMGRAAVGQPWLVGEIARELKTGVKPEPWSARRRANAACTHYTTLLRTFGRDKGLRHARKHLAGYAAHAGQSGPGQAWHRRLVSNEDPDAVLRMLEDMFLDSVSSKDAHGAGAAA